MRQWLGRNASLRELLHDYNHVWAEQHDRTQICPYLTISRSLTFPMRHRAIANGASSVSGIHFGTVLSPFEEC